MSSDCDWGGGRTRMGWDSNKAGIEVTSVSDQSRRAFAHDQPARVGGRRRKPGHRSSCTSQPTKATSRRATRWRETDLKVELHLVAQGHLHWADGRRRRADRRSGQRSRDRVRMPRVAAVAVPRALVKPRHARLCENRGPSEKTGRIIGATPRSPTARAMSSRPLSTRFSSA